MASVAISQPFLCAVFLSHQAAGEATGLMNYSVLLRVNSRIIKNAARSLIDHDSPPEENPATPELHGWHYSTILTRHTIALYFL
jgi:hypothetical protein